MVFLLLVPPIFPNELFFVFGPRDLQFRKKKRGVSDYYARYNSPSVIVLHWHSLENI